MGDEERMKGLFRQEEKYARQAAASWIGHPEVRRVVEGLAPAAGTAMSFLRPHLVDQVQITRFCRRICGTGARYADGSEDPNPFDPDGPEPWPLTDAEREAARYIAALFHRIVLVAAQRLADQGVDIDPEWAPDQATVAVLLLMAAKDEYVIAWDDPRTLAGQLQPLGVSGISRNGREVSARDGRPSTMAMNADAIRDIVRTENGGRDLQVAYAGGGTRQTRSDTQIRREILLEIYEDHPDLTVSRLWDSYDYERTVGGRLRRALEERLTAAGITTIPGKPSKSTLYKDFKEIGIPTGSDG